MDRWYFIFLLSFSAIQLCTGLLLSGSSSFAMLNQTFQFTCTFNGSSTVQTMGFRRDKATVCTIAFPFDPSQCRHFTSSPGYSCSCGQDGVYYMNISSVSLQDETTWDCQLSSQTSATISLTVYYGPFTNMTISQSSPVTVTEGVTSPSVSCSAQCKPGCNYKWTRGNKQVSTNKDFSLTGLTRDEAGDYICTARNTATNAVADSPSITVIVYYPPSLPPVISGTSSTPVYEGDTVTFTCRVIGGNPLVTTVTLTCPGGHQNSTTTTEGSATRLTALTFSVTRDLRSQSCRCSAVHITGRYQLTANMTKDSVYYAPSIQTVSVSPAFPWLEGRTGSLTCVPSDAGHPNATYIWYRDGVRQTQETGQTWQYTSLVYTDNGRQIYCQTENLFTEHRGSTLKSSNITLNVYYSPRVQTTPSSSVTKTEGDALTVECTAVSNPPPTGYQWSYGSEVKSSGPQLSFPSLDRTDHGEYRCSATTQAGSYGIQTGTATVQVTVNYPPKLTVRNVTETESQQATIICVADGRPDNFYFFPFVHTWKGHVIRHVTGQRAGREYMHVFVSSSYQDSGVYGCAVENSVSDELGEKQQKGYIFVKINGSPKLTVGIRKEDIVEAETGEMVTLLRTFYSSTSITSYTWRKDTKTLNSTRMFDTTVQLDIHGVVVEDKGYNFTLDIGQFDQDEHSGQYSLRVCNSIGCETSTITLKLQVSDMTHPDTGSVAGIVGGCVAGVVTVCLLIAGVVLLYRKGYKCNFCISKTDDDNQKESETRVVDTSPTYSTIDVPDQSERRTQYCSLESTELQQYTGLKLYENTGVDNKAVDDVDSHHDTSEQGSQHAYENTGAALQNEPT